MLHALEPHHAVDTLTLAPWGADQVNLFYGTSIRGARVGRHVVPLPWSIVAAFPEGRLYRLRMSILLRAARALAAGYDLLVTADDYGAFERPGLQYVHFPAAFNRGTAGAHTVVRVYFAWCDRLLGLPWERAAANLTLANSRWTAVRLRGAPRVRVMYPPVADPGEGDPWDARADTFLCVGRFHPTKRIETVVSIVRRLRAGAIPGARLLIVGSAVHAAYARTIRRTAARDADWIAVREDVARSELHALMGRSRYGLHAMADEHFGMATAEMARAGCLVFPHKSGGSVEAVGGEPRLLWATEDEAVSRVGALAIDAGARDEVRARLRRHAAGFSAERFVDEFLAVVAEQSH